MILKHFHHYDKTYILSIITYFRENNILPFNSYHSYPGWNIFVKKYIINKINEYIKNDLNTRIKKLKFTYVYSNLYNYDNDVLNKICDLIK